LGLEHDGTDGAADAFELLGEPVGDLLRGGVRDAEPAREVAAESEEGAAGGGEEHEPADDDEPRTASGEAPEAGEQSSHEEGAFRRSRVAGTGTSSGWIETIQHMSEKG